MFILDTLYPIHKCSAPRRQAQNLRFSTVFYSPRAKYRQGVLDGVMMLATPALVLWESKLHFLPCGRKLFCKLPGSLRAKPQALIRSHALDGDSAIEISTRVLRKVRLRMLTGYWCSRHPHYGSGKKF
jgi:hypothetical protein